MTKNTMTAKQREIGEWIETALIEIRATEQREVQRFVREMKGRHTYNDSVLDVCHDIAHPVESADTVLRDLFKFVL